MKRKIITTGDGSKTIHLEEWNEQYHSIHGAINEANHVFIRHGLLFYSEFISESNNQSINILEIGFGTGLNAFLTLIEAEKLNVNINYTGIEAYPVTPKEIETLNYADLISKTHDTEFETMHSCSWEINVTISKHFKLTKRQQFFEEITDISSYNIIYFDAFGARVQPDLWTKAMFKKMHTALKPNGVLVTYSAKGSVRRALQNLGFRVERLDGPPNKRHMLRAIKS